MTVFLSTISAITNTSPGEDLDGAIEGYQRSLIKEETTGSNVVMIFKDGKRIYHKPVQSGLAGDKQIDEKTIFPVWSMSKPITTVAMLILHEEGKFDWNDEVSRFIPCFQTLTWKSSLERTAPDGDILKLKMKSTLMVS